MTRCHPVPRSAPCIAITLAVALAGCTGRPTDVPTPLPAFGAVAQQTRYTVLQQTLEHNEQGQGTRWGLGTIRGSTVPLGTFSSAAFGWCRDYEERIAVPAEEKNYRMVGIACRDPSGSWLVVDIRPFIETTATVPHV